MQRHGGCSWSPSCNSKIRMTLAFAVAILPSFMGPTLSLLLSLRPTVLGVRVRVSHRGFFCLRLSLPRPRISGGGGGSRPRTFSLGGLRVVGFFP